MAFLRLLLCSQAIFILFFLQKSLNLLALMEVKTFAFAVLCRKKAQVRIMSGAVK